MQNFDVLIIGNGILGYSTAYALFLEDPSLNIGIIGPFNRLPSATEAAGAMLGCFGEVTQSGIDSQYGLKKLEMSIDAAKLWSAWLEQINASSAYPDQVGIVPGTFVILNAKSGILDSKNYTAILQTLRKYHEPYEEVDPCAIEGLNPVDSCRPLRALYLPNEGAINPNQLIAALDSIFHNNRKNFKLINDCVEEIKISDAKINYVATKSGNNYQAKCVLLASGVYSQTLIDRIPELKNRIPRLLAGVGHSLIIEPKVHKLQHTVRSPNRSGACGLHVLPQSQNSIYVGASNNLALAPEDSPRLGMLNFIFECLLEELDTSFYDAKITKFLIGNRPATVDTFPLIGKTSIEGLWLLTGTYRDGIHQSPLLAQSLAKQILGRNPLFNNSFLPERLPIQTMNRNQAIKETVAHYIGGAHEHRIHLPRIGWDLMLEEMIQQRIEEVYKKLDTERGLPPDLMIMIERDMQKYIPYFRKYYHLLGQENFSEIKIFDTN